MNHKSGYLHLIKLNFYAPKTVCLKRVSQYGGEGEITPALRTRLLQICILLRENNIR
jgi:hypothetical protein